MQTARNSLSITDFKFRLFLTKVSNMTRWLPIPIFIASCIATYDYHMNPTGWYNLALFSVPLTMLLTVLMLRALPADTPTLPNRVSWQPFTRRHLTLLIGGIGCFIVIAQVHGDHPLLLGFLFGMPHAHQFFLFIVGIILITWGMTGGITLTDGWQKCRSWTHESDAKWLMLFILLGLIVRSLSLESAIHYYTDEANFATGVTLLRTNPDIQIMNNIDPIANFTWIYPYFQYYFTEIFGATLGNLRAVSVIIGTVTIPAIYLLGRWAFNRRIGLLAAFLLAFYLPHVHFSRFARYDILDPFLGLMTISLLWRGLQTDSRRMLALGGVFLGMTSYFYEAGRLLYPALIIVWLLIYPFISNRKISRRGIGIFLASTVLISSGFYLSLSVSGQNIAPRLLHQNVSSGFWAKLLTSSDALEQISLYFDNRLNPAYLHIVSQPDGSGFYYSREVGLILPYMLPFMLIGLGVALYHWRRSGLILPLWLLLTILGNSLIIWNNWSPRFVVLFPALVLLIALGLNTIYQVMMWGWFISAAAQRLFRHSAIILLILITILQIGYYFGVMVPDLNVAIRSEMDDQDAGYRAQILPPEAQVYILPLDDQYHIDVEVMQAYEKQSVPVNVIEADTFNFTTLNPAASHPYAFFIVPGDNDTLNHLQRLFGDRLTGPQWSPYNVPSSRQFALYQVAGL